MEAPGVITKNGGRTGLELLCRIRRVRLPSLRVFCVCFFYKFFCFRRPAVRSSVRACALSRGQVERAFGAVISAIRLDWRILTRSRTRREFKKKINKKEKGGMKEKWKRNDVMLAFWVNVGSQSSMSEDWNGFDGSLFGKA